jgi:hypothetical protein
MIRIKWEIFLAGISRCVSPRLRGACCQVASFTEEVFAAVFGAQITLARRAVLVESSKTQAS